jgi:hypothetical protein
MADQRQKPDPQENRVANHPGQGPTSIAGAEASELPDKGRGTPETNPGKELSRKLSIQTGAAPESGADVGLAATPNAADARDHGNRKNN